MFIIGTFLNIHPDEMADPPCKWDFKTWPTAAHAQKLVLTGWGADLPSLPTQDWTDKKRGGLTQANWLQLVRRIPHEWHRNPHHKVQQGELSLALVRLDEFLQDHPGTFSFTRLICFLTSMS